VKTSTLLLSNVPYNVSDREIRQWIESRGVGTKSIRMIRALEADASPASGRHVELTGSIELKDAISILDGKKMRNRTILAREVPAYVLAKTFMMESVGTGADLIPTNGGDDRKW
jgi:hypothetical protein